ncbi:MAG: adenylosuccinate lyase [Rhodospirillaceae bacterium]|nr:adenylosuccinate lyase [Rhodospirillaceae bacterium]
MQSTPVNLSKLTALSPLDGRYASKTGLLRNYLTESALIRYRTVVEISWLKHLASEKSITGLPDLDNQVIEELKTIIENFSIEDASQVKTLESQTNHDVKAVEYFLRNKLLESNCLSNDIEAYIHFACTSEDINNLSYALILSDTRQNVLLPIMQELIDDLRTIAHEFADIPMLSRTHGQPASPTTLGKEFANFVHRFEIQLTAFKNINIFGKCNGAVGNFNAHLVAYPNADWPKISKTFVESLGLVYTPYTTQIEPHDWIAEYCHSLIRTNTILLDLCRDLWGYVSLGYFRPRVASGEVGSSTMPHKVNPIEFENAEGNCGIANSLLGFLAEKLPQSRWQRDLTDSTVLRNIAVGIGHTYLAISSCRKGLSKLQADYNSIQTDLENSPEILAEAVQTVMRSLGIPDAYEQLKKLTRGQNISNDNLSAFISKLDIPEDIRGRLKALSPSDYIGIASQLARDI